MSIVECPECENEVSDKADACPNCGYPMESNYTNPKFDSSENKKTKNSSSIGWLQGVFIFIFVVLFIGWLSAPSGNNLGNNSYEGTPEPNHDKGMAWQMTQDFVTKRIKSPSTAEFPWSSDVEINQSGKEYTIDGYVDAQNSFGATVRQNFVAKVRYDGNETWSLIELEFE